MHQACKAHVKKNKRERYLSLSFLTRIGLVLANTWGRENMIGEDTKKPWHKSELLGHGRGTGHTSRFYCSECVIILRAKLCGRPQCGHWVYRFCSQRSLANHLQHFHRSRCPASSKPHPIFLCIGAQRQSGELRWRRSGIGPNLQKFLRIGET